MFIYQSSEGLEYLGPDSIEHRLENYKNFLDANANSNPNLQEDRLNNLNSVTKLLAIAKLDLSNCENRVLDDNARLLAIYRERPYLHQYIKHHSLRLNKICTSALEDSVEFVSRRYENQREMFKKMIDSQNIRQHDHFSIDLVQAGMAQYLSDSQIYKQIKNTRGESKKVMMSRVIEEDFGPHCRELRYELGKLEALYNLLKEAEPNFEQKLRRNTRFWMSNIELCRLMFSREVDYQKVYDGYASLNPSLFSKMKGKLLA